MPTQANYWQAAGLWFFVIILFAWTGFGGRPRSWIQASRRSDWDQFGDRIERKVKARVSQWADSPDHDLEDKLEARIKRGFSRWVDTDDDMDWDDLGEHIERKIKRHLREWLDED